MLCRIFVEMISIHDEDEDPCRTAGSISMRRSRMSECASVIDTTVEHRDRNIGESLAASSAPHNHLDTSF